MTAKAQRIFWLPIAILLLVVATPWAVKKLKK